MHNTKHNAFSKGNLSNQKYEAISCIRHHVESITNANPSKETSRWRNEKNYRLVKHEGKRRLLDKMIESDNVILSDRMYLQATEDRVTKSREFCPGFRVGRGGTVIDCYESSCQRFYEYKAYIKRKLRKLRDGDIQRNNEFIWKYLEASRSSCARKDLKKSYENNRVLYNFLASRTPHSALHLGLLEKAKSKINQRKSSPAKSPKFQNNSQISHDSAGNDKESGIHNINRLASAISATEKKQVGHISGPSRLELNSARKDHYSSSALSPLFAECARYSSIAAGASQARDANLSLPPLRSFRREQEQGLREEDYNDGDSSRGLRKLLAMRHRDPNVLQESQWSELFDEVEAEIVQEELQEQAEMENLWRQVIAQDPELAPVGGDASPNIGVDDGERPAALTALSLQLRGEFGEELSVLFESLFTRRRELQIEEEKEARERNDGNFPEAEETHLSEKNEVQSKEDKLGQTSTLEGGSSGEVTEKGTVSEGEQLARSRSQSGTEPQRERRSLSRLSYDGVDPGGNMSAGPSRRRTLSANPSSSSSGLNLPKTHRETAHWHGELKSLSVEGQATRIAGTSSFELNTGSRDEDHDPAYPIVMNASLCSAQAMKVLLQDRPYFIRSDIELIASGPPPTGGLGIDVDLVEESVLAEEWDEYVSHNHSHSINHGGNSRNNSSHNNSNSNHYLDQSPKASARSLIVGPDVAGDLSLRADWLCLNMKRASVVWEGLSSSTVLASHGTNMIPRQLLLCQCAISLDTIGPRKSDLQTISANGIVQSYLLNIMDVGYRLRGNRKPNLSQVLKTTSFSSLPEVSEVCSPPDSPFSVDRDITSKSKDRPLNKVDRKGNSIGSSPSYNDFKESQYVPLDKASEDFSQQKPQSPEVEATISHYSLTTSTGILLELVPILNNGVEIVNSEDSPSMGYCSRFLSVKQLADLANKHGFAELVSSLTEVLQNPVDPMIVGGSVAAVNSSLSCGLFCALSTVLDADTDRLLFEMISKNILVRCSEGIHELFIQ